MVCFRKKYSVLYKCLYLFENMYVESKFPHFFSLPLKFMLSHLGRRDNSRIVPPKL